MAQGTVGDARQHFRGMSEARKRDCDVGFGTGEGCKQLRRLQQEFASRRGEPQQYLAEANDAFGHAQTLIVGGHVTPRLYKMIG